MDPNQANMHFVDSMGYLRQLNENIVLETFVNIDKLLPDWKPRSFEINVAVSIIRTDLLPFIFDWPLINELMEKEQTNGTRLLQEKVNDLELLYKLSNSMQRIQITEKPENNFHVKMFILPPTYEMKLLDNGTIMINRLPSLLIEVVSHDFRMTDDVKSMELADINPIQIFKVEGQLLGSVQHMIQLTDNSDEYEYESDHEYEYDYEYDNEVDDMHYQMDTSLSSISTELFTIEELDEENEGEDEDEDNDNNFQLFFPLAAQSKLSLIQHSEYEDHNEDEDDRQGHSTNQQTPRMHRPCNNLPIWGRLNYWMRKALLRLIMIR
ncbi:uncharacterized protein LOC111519313 [Drosophila willistoni]|uniref:uncharacterized protein LOC111519313 n=1 Tax=Drosophila willistoni TaxID=7260 RepID=UPI000C26D983|nr:uncharacterized protein LOC111519313 [Drosophila willistoni]